MPWSLYLENMVTELRNFGCDSPSLTAHSCHHWLPGNVIKAPLIAFCGCGPLFVRHRETGGVLNAFQHPPSLVLCSLCQASEAPALCAPADI